MNDGKVQGAAHRSEIKTHDGKYTLVFDWAAIYGFQKSLGINTFEAFKQNVEQMDPTLTMFFTYWALQRNHDEEFTSDEDVANFLDEYGHEETITPCLWLAFVPNIKELAEAAAREAEEAAQKAEAAEVSEEAPKKTKARKNSKKPS